MAARDCKLVLSLPSPCRSIVTSRRLPSLRLDDAADDKGPATGDKSDVGAEPSQTLTRDTQNTWTILTAQLKREHVKTPTETAPSKSDSNGVTLYHMEGFVHPLVVVVEPSLPVRIRKLGFWSSANLVEILADDDYVCSSRGSETSSTQSSLVNQSQDLPSASPRLYQHVQRFEPPCTAAKDLAIRFPKQFRSDEATVQLSDILVEVTAASKNPLASVDMQQVRSMVQDRELSPAAKEMMDTISRNMASSTAGNKLASSFGSMGALSVLSAMLPIMTQPNTTQRDKMQSKTSARGSSSKPVPSRGTGGQPTSRTAPSVEYDAACSSQTSMGSETASLRAEVRRLIHDTRQFANDMEEALHNVLDRLDRLEASADIQRLSRASHHRDASQADKSPPFEELD